MYCHLKRCYFYYNDCVFFQKEEVETALKASNMVFEDALEMLSMTGGANWRGRHSDLEPPFDHSGFPSQRFNPQQLPFAPPVSMSCLVLVLYWSKIGNCITNYNNYFSHFSNF